jgi:hypothetical protein
MKLQKLWRLKVMTNHLETLQAPFKPSDIEWRVQRAMSTKRGNKAVVLAYVTNRAIMNRLDEVFGIGNWKNEYIEWRDKGVLCGISAKLDGEWVTKWDGAEETNIEAVKGGFSGSMKRAAVQWGIGRYLYKLEEVWVDVKDRGQNYINDKKAGVQGYWDTPTLPNWALPNAEPITSQQVGTLKTKALTFGKLRGKSDAEVYEALSINDVTELSSTQADEIITKIDGWIAKAEKESA